MANMSLWEERRRQPALVGGKQHFAKRCVALLSWPLAVCCCRGLLGVAALCRLSGGGGWMREMATVGSMRDQLFLTGRRSPCDDDDGASEDANIQDDYEKDDGDAAYQGCGEGGQDGSQ